MSAATAAANTYYHRENIGTNHTDIKKLFHANSSAPTASSMPFKWLRKIIHFHIFIICAPK